MTGVPVRFVPRRGLHEAVRGARPAARQHMPANPLEFRGNLLHAMWLGQSARLRWTKGGDSGGPLRKCGIQLDEKPETGLSSGID